MNRSTLRLIGLLTGLSWPLAAQANTASSAAPYNVNRVQANPDHPESSMPHPRAADKPRPATIASSAPLHHPLKDKTTDPADETINAGRYEKLEPQHEPAPVRLELRDAR